MLKRPFPALLAIFALLALAQPSSADDEALYQKLIQDKAGPVVSVKLVLHVKFSMGGASREQEVNSTAEGIVVDKTGLVMLPSRVFDPLSGMRRSHRRVPQGVTVSPQNIRVIFPGDTREYDAILGAKDSKLGLGFVLIRDLKEKAPTSLDLGTTAEPRIGQTLYAVSRLDQGFDFAPLVHEAKVVGRVSKPRDMWTLAGAGTLVGEPLYDANGAVVGVVVNQEGVGEDSAARPFLLPLKVAQPTIASSLKKSKEELDRILEDEEDAAAQAGDEAKKDEGKKDAGKKDAPKKDEGKKDAPEKEDGDK
jgi:S1-C subfamily serine protease